MGQMWYQHPEQRTSMSHLQAQRLQQAVDLERVTDRLRQVARELSRRDEVVNASEVQRLLWILKFQTSRGCCGV